MSLRVLEVAAEDRFSRSIRMASRHACVLDYHAEGLAADGRRTHRLILGRGDRQGLVDWLQTVLVASHRHRIVIYPVDAVIPYPKRSRKNEEIEKSQRERAIREEVFDRANAGARLDASFIGMVIIAVIVTALGLIEDNVAVIIGAMVIAPLLGPVLALAMAVALGDGRLLRRALRTNAVGMGLTLSLTVSLGLVWQGPLDAEELLARTEIGLDGVAIALASGAAAALSLLNRQLGPLVGVMVAVALMPPATTAGLMIGQERWQEAEGALLMLAINVLCVLLSSLAVFFWRGVRPRSWTEKQRARQSTALSAVLLSLLLLALVAVLLQRPGLE